MSVATTLVLAANGYMPLVLGIGLIAFVLFLLWNGRGGLDSERFARRYPLSAQLHREAEAARKEAEQHGS